MTRVRPSLAPLGWGLLAWMAAAMLLAAGLAVAGLAAGQRSLAVAAVPAGLILGGFGTIPLLAVLFDRALTRYILDDEGVAVAKGWLNTTATKVPWSKVSTATWGHGLVEGRLGLSHVVVSAYGGHGTTLRLHGLREGRAVWRRLQGAVVANATRETWLGDD